MDLYLTKYGRELYSLGIASAQPKHSLAQVCTANIDFVVINRIGIGLHRFVHSHALVGIGLHSQTQHWYSQAQHGSLLVSLLVIILEKIR